MRGALSMQKGLSSLRLYCTAVERLLGRKRAHRPKLNVTRAREDVNGRYCCVEISSKFGESRSSRMHSGTWLAIHKDPHTRTPTQELQLKSPVNHSDLSCMPCCSIVQEQQLMLQQRVLTQGLETSSSYASATDPQLKILAAACLQNVL